ncbi:glutaredoxin family protein [Rhodococcus sp. NPDC019627]|uniref:glutaredoxin family protein n=1 Tax=unclassified Rhodococcus (in: high G+C Gram-positive bacteria) TaxID=192944 RepID=UPI0033E97897
MKPVVLYSRPSCQPCLAVARRLDKNKTPYTKVDVSVDKAAADRLKDLGFQQTPVVECGTTVFYGYSPDRIDALKEHPDVLREVRRASGVEDRTDVEDKG